MNGHGRRRPTARAWVVALSMVLLGVAVPSAAGSVQSAHLISPGSFGPVDFGDRVPYRLAGAGCTSDSVRVLVTTGPAEGRPGKAVVAGARSHPVADPLTAGQCIGFASVPTESAVRAQKWDQGDPISVVLETRADRVTLRYQRVETALAKTAAGTPTVVKPEFKDPRAGRRERAMQMSTGDVISLGRVDLTHIDSISLRLCITVQEPHVTPSLVELREQSPTGPSIIGTVDVGDDFPLGSPQTKSNNGWPNCWWLQPWPVDGTVTERAPELFLAVVASASPIQFEFVDFNGTGAKAVNAAPVASERGFTPLPWRGWTMSNCVLDDDGTVHNKPDTSPTGYAPIATGGLVGPQGCTMQYTKRKLHNVAIRFRFKFNNFGDNGAIMIGGHEVQMRIAGEWLPGGLYGNPLPQSAVPLGVPPQAGIDTSGGGYPAERLKQNSYPDWNDVEILQLGSRHLVRLNGRTVSDSAAVWPDPAPYTFSVASQPQFGYNYRAEIRYDNNYNPHVSQPSSWSNLVWRDFRVHGCTSTADPVCSTIPGVHG